MTTFVADDQRSNEQSPDRVDALVWAIWALQIGPRAYIV